MWKKFASRRMVVFVSTVLVNLLVAWGMPEELATELVQWISTAGVAALIAYGAEDAVRARIAA